MSAYESFHNLGFQKKSDDGWIEYVKPYGSVKDYVRFNLMHREIKCLRAYSVNLNQPMAIDMDLLGAIMLQAKELGWV